MHLCAKLCVTYVQTYMQTHTCAHRHTTFTWIQTCAHTQTCTPAHTHPFMHAHACTSANTLYGPTLSNCQFIICTFLYLYGSSYETLTTFLSQSTAPLSCQECFLHMKKPCSNKKPCELETPLSMCLKYGHGSAISWQLSFHFVAKGVGWNWSLSKVSLTGKTAV